MSKNKIKTDNSAKRIARHVKRMAKKIAHRRDYDRRKAVARSYA